jgi:hypothetical protein
MTGRKYVENTLTGAIPIVGSGCAGNGGGHRTQRYLNQETAVNRHQRRAYSEPAKIQCVPDPGGRQVAEPTGVASGATPVPRIPAVTSPVVVRDRIAVLQMVHRRECAELRRRATSGDDEALIQMRVIDRTLREMRDGEPPYGCMLCHQHRGDDPADWVTVFGFITCRVKDEPNMIVMAICAECVERYSGRDALASAVMQAVAAVWPGFRPLPPLHAEGRA